MTHLDFRQKQLLKKIKRIGTYDCTTIDNETMAKVRFLHSQGLLTTKTKTYSAPSPTGIQVFNGEILSAQISEAGRTYLSEYRSDKFRWWFPVIISIFAAIGAYRTELAAILQAVMQLLK